MVRYVRVFRRMLGKIAKLFNLDRIYIFWNVAISSLCTTIFTVVLSIFSSCCRRPLPRPVAIYSCFSYNTGRKKVAQTQNGVPCRRGWRKHVVIIVLLGDIKWPKEKCCDDHNRKQMHAHTCTRLHKILECYEIFMDPVYAQKADIQERYFPQTRVYFMNRKSINKRAKRNILSVKRGARFEK